MTNSLKHSCPNNDEITLFIDVKKDANSIQITYSDSGNKMTQELYDNSTSMGLKLVKRLTKQLQGEIEFQEHLLILKFSVD
jgi:two-component sensor histidine kinase